MPPPQNQKQPTIFEQYQTAKWLVQFPALTLISVSRRDAGYRLLNPLVLLATNGILFVFGVLAQPGNEKARPILLAAFAAFSFLCGMIQHVLRRFKLGKGPYTHSYYIGTSPFHKWLPEFLRRDRRDARFIDPLFWIGIGLACMTFLSALAVWILFSALCLRLFEFTMQEKELEKQLDTGDSLIDADIQNQTMEQYEVAQDETSSP